MTTAAFVADIHATIAHDIRRVSAAQITISLDVALNNWQFFWDQGRWTEAAAQWRIVHTLLISE